MRFPEPWSSTSLAKTAVLYDRTGNFCLDTVFVLIEGHPSRVVPPRPESGGSGPGFRLYSFYADRAGHLGHTFWRSSWGQNNLSRLADETGAEAYFQVMQMPISYGPYLDGFAERLKH